MSPGLTSRQGLHLNLAKLHHRLRIVLLQGEMSGGEGMVRVDEINRGLAIHFDDDVIADGRYILREPFAGLVELLAIDDLGAVLIANPEGGIEAAGADRIPRRAVDLGLVAL